MKTKTYNVLFLCTGNSARSILAEKLLEYLGGGRFKAFSAGSFPSGKVNPFAVDELRRRGLPTDGLRSKCWDEFSRTDSPAMDFIFTVCDNAAGEVCPVWPGCPVSAHWGIADPAAVQGSDTEKRLAFERAYDCMERHIRRFTGLNLEMLDKVKLKRELDTIGKISS